jgi:cytochrome c biogenesis protein ResB
MMRALWYNGEVMLKVLRFLSQIRLFAAVCILLFFIAMAVVLAFPGARGILTSSWANGVMVGLLILLGVVIIHAFVRKRWLSGLFHIGVALIITGAGLTAGQSREGRIVFTDASYAPMEYRQCMIDGERIALHSFEMPQYPDGMPKQYITHLVFPEGRRSVSVNNPIRRKGWTFYQMSYQQVEGYYGEPVFNTILTVRKDPGARVTFWGYGVVILAAFCLAIRESVRRSRTPSLEGVA